jgi:hypothetical protein
MIIEVAETRSAPLCALCYRLETSLFSSSSFPQQDDPQFSWESEPKGTYNILYLANTFLFFVVGNHELRQSSSYPFPRSPLIGSVN